MTFQLRTAGARRQPITADETEKTALRSLVQALETTQPQQQYILQAGNTQGEQIELPPSVRQGLLQLVRYLAEGHGVEIIPTDKELTTQQAADLLNISRPYLVKLLEAGHIPFSKVGAHRRVRLADVSAYKQQRDTTRRQALQSLTELSQELGLYDE